MQVAGITPTNKIQEETLQQALAGMEIKRFITREGKRNYFMWDNAWEDEKIKGYYRLPETLKTIYRTAPFQVATYHLNYPITDEDRLRRESVRLNSKDLWREVTKQLAELKKCKSTDEASYLMEELGEEFAVMAKAFVLLGEERIAQLDYNRKKIEAALGHLEENRLLTSEKMKIAVYKRFHAGDIVEVAEVNAFMRQLITDQGIPFDGRVDKKVIGLFFEIEECKMKGNRGFRFGKQKYEL